MTNFERSDAGPSNLQMVSLEKSDAGHNIRREEASTTDLLRKSLSRGSDAGYHPRRTTSAPDLLRSPLLRGSDVGHHLTEMVLAPDLLRSPSLRESDAASDILRLRASTSETFMGARKAGKVKEIRTRQREVYQKPSNLEFYHIPVADHSRSSQDHLDVAPITTERSTDGAPVATTGYDHLRQLQVIVKEKLGNNPEQQTTRTWSDYFHSQARAWQARTWSDNLAQIRDWAFSHPNLSESQKLHNYLGKIDEILQRGLDDVRPNQTEDQARTLLKNLAKIEKTLRRASQTKAGDVAFNLGIAAINNVLPSALAGEWLWSGLGANFAASYLANFVAAKVAEKTNGEIKPYPVATQTLVGQLVTVPIVLGSRRGS